MKLTELEKTILLSLFILAKGSTRRYILEKELLSKFPLRQRKFVKNYVGILVTKKLLVRKGNSYRVERMALKYISAFLVHGPKLKL
jgi:hypothetical protein